jgi:tetratricopeptide (TPR) repeat protein
MLVALPTKEQELKEISDRLERASIQEHSAALGASSASLAKSIREGTATLDEIDAFLAKFPQAQPDLKGYLLSKKARLLLQQGSEDEALKHYDAALRTKETPSTWALKGAALLELNRLDEAFHSFQKAYSLRENFGPQKQEYLKDLFQGWSISALLRGLLGILHNDSRELQKGVEAYLEVLENSGKEGLSGAVGMLEAEEPVSEELKAALEELELAIKLLSIKDPFDRWRAFTKEISKVWPKDISAVEAIREQREREWNNW